jgi:hypothetical protein
VSQQASPEFLAQLREAQPQTTATEAFLLERLIGAMGMVRRLMTHGSYVVGPEHRDAYQLLDEFLLERYGWTLAWRDPEQPKSKKARSSPASSGTRTTRPRSAARVGARST